MPPRPLLLLSCLLLACATAPQPPPAAPAQAPAAAEAPRSEPTAPAASTAGDAGWKAVDARAVRCGVDDRPRNVVGMEGAIEATPSLSQAPEPLLEEPQAGRAKRAMPRPRPPSLPHVKVERMPPQIIGGATPDRLASALASIDPRYDECNAMQGEPQAPRVLTFELELTAAGAPLQVVPLDPGQPSAFAHCLMERACRLQAPEAPGKSTRVRLPLRLSPEATQDLDY